MDASIYQQRLQARRAELAAVLGHSPGAGPVAPDSRRRRAEAARRRSARRWQDGDERRAQEQRAGLLRLVPTSPGAG